MVIELYYFVLGLALIIIGSLVGAHHPRKWRAQSNILYVAGMVLMLFAIFVLKDPIEGIPTEVWTILSYIVVVGSFIGFLYKIEWNIRHEFDDKIKTLKTDLVRQIDNLKSDIRRDIDRIERNMKK